MNKLFDKQWKRGTISLIGLIVGIGFFLFLIDPKLTFMDGICLALTFTGMSFGIVFGLIGTIKGVVKLSDWIEKGT